MRTAKLTFSITASLIIASFALFGCGGTSDDGTQYAGEVSYIHISATGGTEGIAVMSDDLDYDAGAGSTGTGDSGDGALSINDDVTGTCQFSATLYGDEGPTIGQLVYTNTDDCDSLNACIVCIRGSNAMSQTCSISCEGVMPSTEGVLVNAIDLFITFDITYLTDMPQVYDNNGTPTNYADDFGGVIRIDGVITDWAEFSDDIALEGEQFLSLAWGEMADCDGAPDLTIAASDPLQIFSHAGTTFARSYAITALDATPDGNGRGNCHLQIDFGTYIDLDTLATPGGSVDMTGGSFVLKTKICDDPQNCPAP